MNVRRLVAVSAITVLAIVSTPGLAAAQMEEVTVQVKGMVCAF